MSKIKQVDSPAAPCKWAVRAVQLDLARQRETVPEIVEFMGFAARWGFNTVVLYLEGVVRTELFPYRDTAQSMSKAQVRQIVDAATELGLQVVPSFNAPGHAEHFLQCPELAHLANTASGISNPEFDVSNPEVYEFLRGYIADLSELFPGEHMMMGCDEAWRFGRDPVSRQRLAGGETWQALFLEHICKVREIAVGCGKRPWIWADMFEYFDDDTIAQVPRDIVLVIWNYTADKIERHGPQGHFNNMQRRDWLAMFQALGFDAMVAPIGDSIFATQRITDWAARYPVMGGLQTLWEMSKLFLPSVKTQIAVTGRLWSNPGVDFESTVSSVIGELYPSLSTPEHHAVRVALGDPLWLNKQVSPVEILHSGRLNQTELQYLRGLQLAEHLIAGRLNSMRAEEGGEEHALLEHLWMRMRYQIVAANMQSLLAEHSDPRGGLSMSDPTALVGWCGDELRELERWFKRAWGRHRKGIAMGGLEGYVLNILSGLQAVTSEIGATPIAHRAVLWLDLFMMDSCAAPSFRIELKPTAGPWQELFHGQIKPRDLARTHYTHLIPLAWPHEGDVQLRVSLDGYGGAGVRYAQLVMQDCRWTPREVVGTQGCVDRESDVLRDDIFACELGGRDVAAALIGQREHEESRIELLLKKQPPVLLQSDESQRLFTA